jgi:membrane protein YqaA with SNARE-associated domain
VHLAMVVRSSRNNGDQSHAGDEARRSEFSDKSGAAAPRNASRRAIAWWHGTSKRSRISRRRPLKLERMEDLAAYGVLFITALTAATVLPFGSEPLFVGLLMAGQQPVWLLVLVASVANTAGAVVNWALGRWVERFQHRRWFPIRAHDLARAQLWYRRHGRWALLLSWAPVVGDAITVAAGVLRERFVVFLVLVGAAKGGRYLALAVFAQELLSA